MALTPHQFRSNDTQSSWKAEQDRKNASFSSIQKQDEADTFSLNIDDPRMRYAGVSSLLTLMNSDSRTDPQPEDKDSKENDELASLFKYTHVTGGL